MKLVLFVNNGDIHDISSIFRMLFILNSLKIYIILVLTPNYLNNTSSNVFVLLNHHFESPVSNSTLIVI